MTYTKYLDNPYRRGNVGDRDHFQHIENTLERVVPGPGEVIVGGADGPVAGSIAGSHAPLDIWDEFDATGAGKGWMADTYPNFIAGLDAHLASNLASGDVAKASLGASSNGQTVYRYTAGNPDGATVILNSGMHGEQIGVRASMRFFEGFVRSNDPVMQRLRQVYRLIWVPVLNPASYPAGRTNANGVDINRNFDFGWADYTPVDPIIDAKGSAAFSEPESKLLRDLILAEKPTIYLDAHNMGGNTANPQFGIYLPSAWSLGARRFGLAFNDVMKATYGNGGEVEILAPTSPYGREPMSMNWASHTMRWTQGRSTATAATLECSANLYGSTANVTTRAAMQVYAGAITTWLAMWLDAGALVQPTPYPYTIGLTRASADAATNIGSGGTLLNTVGPHAMPFTHAIPFGLAPAETRRTTLNVPIVYAPAIVEIEATGYVQAPTDAGFSAGRLDTWMTVDGAVQSAGMSIVSITADASRYYPFQTRAIFQANEADVGKRKAVQLMLYVGAGGITGITVQRATLTAKVYPHTTDAPSFWAY